MNYDPGSVQSFFDAYGEREWARLESTLQGRIKYAIHKRFLDEYIPEGARVLDVGCGPGRFALHLARRGCQLTLVDLSSVQLTAARQRLSEAGLQDHLEACYNQDMLELHRLALTPFDAVVCYGAALCYTYNRYRQALEQLVLQLKHSGRLLLSVDSLYGILRLIGPFDAASFIEQPEAHLDWQAVLQESHSSGSPGIFLSQPGSPEFHQPLVVFTSPGLRQALEQAGLRVILMAAANPLVADGNPMPKVTASSHASQALLELEVAACTQPGLLDTGEHMIAVAEKEETSHEPTK